MRRSALKPSGMASIFDSARSEVRMCSRMREGLDAIWRDCRSSWGSLSTADNSGLRSVNCAKEGANNR
eukprot:119232-Pelagomonas_calceolata.AAC.1